MSTISINDLSKQPADQWLQLAGKDDVVITSHGQPVAVLLPIDAQSLESALSVLRSVRALQAQAALHQAANANGTSGMSMEDIHAEIKAARQARKRK